MQVERTILCPASEYQKHLSGLVLQGLHESKSQDPKARSLSNSIMELRNISNHPFLVRLTWLTCPRVSVDLHVTKQAYPDHAYEGTMKRKGM